MKMKVYVVTVTSVSSGGDFENTFTAKIKCVFATQEAADEYCKNQNFPSKWANHYDWKEVDFVEEINNALIDFENDMKPLTEIIDALHVLRSNNQTLDAFREIKDDRVSKMKNLCIVNI
jgi:hypothetical protein